MKCVACDRLAVPTGTAAAAVVAAAPSEDAVREARRFARLESLDDAGLRAAFEELVVAGVYTVLERAVLVVRVSSAGVRRLGVVCAIAAEDDAAVGAACDGGPGAELRAGLAIAPAVPGLADIDADGCAALAALLEEETRRRPVFHGTCADGTTYSGFAAEAAEPILEAATALVARAAARPAARPTAPSPLAIVFAGEPLALPRGLAVRVGPASA